MRRQDHSQTLVDQFELLEKIIAAYEKPDVSDEAQYEAVFALLEALQEIGRLPSTLLTELDLEEACFPLSTL